MSIFPPSDDSPETRRCKACKSGKKYSPWISECCNAAPFGEVGEDKEYEASGICRNCGCLFTFTRDSSPCKSCDGDMVVIVGEGHNEKA